MPDRLADLMLCPCLLQLNVSRLGSRPIGLLVDGTRVECSRQPLLHCPSAGPLLPELQELPSQLGAWRFHARCCGSQLFRESPKPWTGSCSHSLVEADSQRARQKQKKLSPRVVPNADAAFQVLMKLPAFALSSRRCPGSL